MIKLKYYLDCWNTKEACYIEGLSAIEYFIDYGKRHNINGPAIIYSTGDKSYYIYNEHLGYNLTEEVFKKKIKELVFA